jgi:hypothetical protein
MNLNVIIEMFCVFSENGNASRVKGIQCLSDVTRFHVLLASTGDDRPSCLASPRRMGCLAVFSQFRLTFKCCIFVDRSHANLSLHALMHRLMSLPSFIHVLTVSSTKFRLETCLEFVKFAVNCRKCHFLQ